MTEPKMVQFGNTLILPRGTTLDDVRPALMENFRYAQKHSTSHNFKAVEEPEFVEGRSNIADAMYFGWVVAVEDDRG